MDLRRTLNRRPDNSYNQAVRDVLGSPGERRPDALALTWAHQIAWATHGDTGMDELEQLSNITSRYDVPLDAVLEERRRQQNTAPVVPAYRPATGSRAPARRVSRLA